MFVEQRVIDLTLLMSIPFDNLGESIKLTEVTRSIMFTMGVPKYFWDEVFPTTFYLINMMPTKVLKFGIL